MYINTKLKILFGVNKNRIDSTNSIFIYLTRRMGFVGYVPVCVQLYCRGKLSLFHTTCFGLYGHLQVCRMLLLSCS
jgi:hypothetical protein